MTKTWGTWFTGEGEQADAWPSEVKSAGGPGVGTRDALTAGSRLGLGGGGAGLGGVLERAFVGAGPTRGLF